LIEWAAGTLAIATREITLFAAIGLLIGGIDDLAIDLLWIGRTVRRRFTVYRHHPRMTAATLPPPDNPGRIAIFIAAWEEVAVIGTMLRNALATLRHDDYRIYVGTYHNDPATAAAVRAVNDPRVRLVGGDLPGPTSKAECLNRVWRAMLADERHAMEPFKAILLHDAEDVVHPDELRLFDRLIERFDFIQIPVLPLVDSKSRWVSGSYIDEFSEAHARQMIVREALGAGIPSAGVGSAISRRALGWIAAAAGGSPFDETSLTEDYEIGLRLRRFGGREAFVVMPERAGALPVAVRAYFPATFKTAVRQKARWTVGIALAGWDRLGWGGGIAERWMRLRDRRAVLAAIIIAASYGALVLGTLCWALGVSLDWPGWAMPALSCNLALLCWRIAMRAATVARFYGPVQGCLSIPRIVMANFIAIAAAARALWLYIPGTMPPWDKTEHHFPRAATGC
jgi:adsorption protein B